MLAESIPPSVEENVRRMAPVAAAPAERDAMVRLERVLVRGQADPQAYKIVGPEGEVGIPASVFHLLERLVEVMARGDSITLVPVGQELTTQQAANLLNVSRQYLVRLLDQGEIRFTKTGKHRRLRVEDVLNYKTRRDRRKRKALDDLTALSQELGEYDDLG